jgi:hypothetical protein
MGILPSGYVAVIVIQQLAIIGLFWGIVLLLQKLDRLRRGVKIRTALEKADLRLAGYGLASSQPPELRSEPATVLAGKRALKDDARILTSVKS